MRFGVVLPAELGRTADPQWVVTFARHVEALGYDEISVVEHSVVIGATESAYPYTPDGRYPLPDDCPLPDPLELLAFLAGQTSSLGLATGVLVLPNHQPVVLAKRLATLDRLCGGRLRICVGLGWLREEIEACGGHFARRGELADEAIAAMRALWDDNATGGARFAGTTWRFQRAYSYPKPARPGGVPIYIGGHSLAAARRAGRVGNGFQPLRLAGEQLDQALAALRAAAEHASRDPNEIELVLGGTLRRVDRARVEDAERYGATRILLSVSRGAQTLDDVAEQLTDAAKRLGLSP